MPAPPDPLQVHADAFGERAAIVIDPAGDGHHDPGNITFGELNRDVNRLAHAFRALGAAPGERLVWCGPNSPEVLTTIHAARKAGLVAVPLSYRFNAEEMQYVIANSDATLEPGRDVAAEAEHAADRGQLVAHLGDQRRLLGVGDHERGVGGDVPAGFERWADVLDGQPDTEPSVEDAKALGAQMIYTSGTTGKPKGALRTTTDAALVLALLGELGLVPGDEVHLTTGPLYHSGPLAFASLAHTLGAPVVLLRKFDPSAWLHLVKEHRVTNTFSAPTQLKRIVSLAPGELERADLSSMRCLIANAAPVPYALKQEIVAKLGEGFLYEVYGSTELGVVTVLKPEDQLRKPGSCGKVYGGIEIKLVQEDGTEAPVGEPGELFIRTTLAMDGYHRTAEQLAELDDDSQAGVGGGWKSVGDVAVLDDEGYLSICDRKKDMIISGGVNIYPAEIEAVLYEHPDLLDAAVIGIPDDEWGESVHAIVQAKPGRTVDLDELRTFVDARVGGYKRPRAYELRDELPRTDSGKLLKRLLRDEYWQDRERAV